MPEKIDIAYALRLPPEKAIEYFTAKGYVLSPNHWSEMLGQAHAKAFTVARVARMDVLQDIRGAVQKSLAGGQTFSQFRDNIEPTLKAKGWWGKQIITNYTNQEKVVQLGSPRRLKTIYRENLTDAYVTGDWLSAEENKADRPYGQWHALHDRHTRPSHMALDGKIFPLSDPFWKTHVPGKLDWGCRCFMTTLSEQDLKDDGLKPESSAGRMSERNVTLPVTGAVVQVPVYKDPLTGEEVAAGVGRGYNPAMAAYQPDLDSYDYDIARNYIKGAVTGPAFQRFYGGKSVEDFPVAVLSPEFRELIGAKKTQTVTLSRLSLDNKKVSHPELGLADWQGIQSVIDNAAVVIQDKIATLVFVRKGDKIFHLVVSSTREGGRLYINSLRLTSEEEVLRILVKYRGKIRKNEWR